MPAWPRQFLVALLTLAFAVACGGCGEFPSAAPNHEGPGRRPQQLGLSPREELELGRRAYQQLLLEYRDRLLPTDSEPVRRVRHAASRVVRAALTIEPLQREINLHVKGYRFEWEVNVVDSRTVNAVCLPGGKILVFSGILRVAENDDQIATVLSHEIAHALAHHASERVARDQSGHVSFLWSKHYDRQQESEADHIGVFLMTFAGYDPHQAIRFWERMAAVEGQRGNIPEFLSDHPNPGHRVADLRRWVPQALAGKESFDQGRIAPAGSRSQ